MKPSITYLSIKPRLPPTPPKLFQVPDISTISPSQLPNSGFGKGTYHISKTKFGHWPVYKKVQNTKTTTEIKRVAGDVLQFKKDLIKLGNLSPKSVTVNQTAGYVNIKGDVVESVKKLFDENIE